MTLPTGSSVTTDMLAHYPHCPTFYLVARGLSVDDAQAVNAAMHITPISFVITTQPQDNAYALQFGTDTVVQVADLDAAKNFATNFFNTADGLGRSAIIVEQLNKLTGVYPNREANIPC